MPNIPLISTFAFIISQCQAKYTDFEFTSGQYDCQVRECQSYDTNCTEYVDIDDPAALPYILNEKGDCYEDIAFGECSANELVWTGVYYDRITASYSTCNCPKCGCTTENDIIIKEIIDPWHYCYACECQVLSDDWGANATVTELGYLCNEIAFDFSPSNWQCPPPSCTDQYGTVHYGSDPWWDGNDTSCETFCVCQLDGTAMCSSSYADIFTNEQLKNAFIDECEWDSRACVTQPDSFVAGSGYSSFWGCDCPDCSCPSGVSEGESFWTGYIDESALESADDIGFLFWSSDPYECIPCTCESGKSDCAWSGVSAQWDITSSCNDEDIIQCYEGDDISSSASSFRSISDELDQDYCVPLSDKCSIRQQSAALPLDIGDTESGDRSYACSDPFVCDMIDIEDGGCAKASFNTPFYFYDDKDNDGDCELEKYDIVVTDYQSCCSGDLCNNYLLNTKTCEKNDVFGGYTSTIWQCTFGSQAWWKTYGSFVWLWLSVFSGGGVCSLSLEQLQIFAEPCEFTRLMMESTLACPCVAYSSLYGSPSASDASKQKLQDYMDEASVGLLTSLNNEYQCGLSFTCDLATGTANLADEDYLVKLDARVDCVPSYSTEAGSYFSLNGCEDAEWYLWIVSIANNVTIVIDNIDIQSCSMNGDVMSVKADMAFGSISAGQLFESKVQDGSLNWLNEDCPVVSVFTSETIKQDDDFTEENVAVAEIVDLDGQTQFEIIFVLLGVICLMLHM